MQPLNKKTIEQFIEKNGENSMQIRFMRHLDYYCDIHENISEEKEFLKSEYQKIKESANTVSEIYFKTIFSFFRKQFPEDPINDFLLFDISSTYAHNLPGILKKVNNKKNLDQDSKATNALKILIDEILPINESLKMVKEQIVAKKKEKIEKESEIYLKEKKQLSHKDVVKTKELLTESMTEAKNSIKELIEKDYKNKISTIEKEFPENTIVDKKTIEKFLERKRIQPDVLKELTNAARDDSREGRIKLRLKMFYKENNEINEIVKKKSEQDASFMIDSFVAKNTSKVAAILNEKDNLKAIKIAPYTIRNGLIESAVTFNFKDNSSFVLDSSVEYAVSKNNNLFLRFPSRFRNVQLPDGSLMKSPSEENMHKVFTKKSQKNKLKIN